MYLPEKFLIHVEIPPLKSMSHLPMAHTDAPVFLQVPPRVNMKPKNSGIKISNVMAEKVSVSPVQSGLFAALIESKSVYGLYCGHDHLNNFSGKYLGIELGYVASIGYDGYGHGGTFENNNSARGGRVIEATLIGDTVSVSSRFAFASEYGITRE